jgi:secondary thiamine-phosphate synthase enzyme
MPSFTVKTSSPCEMIDITRRISDILHREGTTDGICQVFVPHTTAAVTINENADPDVPMDILTILDRMVPLRGGYRHLEGNSAAHVKASLIGASETVFIEEGRLVLGTWQSVFFCEFDGPRVRQVIVKILSSHFSP